MKTKEKIFEEYIGNGQIGVDFEKSHILDAMEVYAEQFKLNWISVKKELPIPSPLLENAKMYLILVHGNYPVTATYLKGYENSSWNECRTDYFANFYDDGTKKIYRNVTHWMAIPELKTNNKNLGF